MTPLTLPIREATAEERAERLSCLLCGNPTVHNRTAPPCEYIVRYRTRPATVTAGLHAACLERNREAATGFVGGGAACT